jgi:hypothetical protein
MSQFHGLTYVYPTPNNGPREIGVTRGLGDVYIVAWINDRGATKRIKTPHLPPMTSASNLQAALDAYAADRRIPRHEAMP